MSGATAVPARRRQRRRLRLTHVKKHNKPRATINDNEAAARDIILTAMVADTLSARDREAAEAEQDSDEDYSEEESEESEEEEDDEDEEWSGERQGKGRSSLARARDNNGRASTKAGRDEEAKSRGAGSHRRHAGDADDMITDTSNHRRTGTATAAHGGDAGRRAAVTATTTTTNNTTMAAKAGAGNPNGAGAGRGPAGGGDLPPAGNNPSGGGGKGGGAPEGPRKRQPRLVGTRQPGLVVPLPPPGQEPVAVGRAAGHPTDGQFFDPRRGRDQQRVSRRHLKLAWCPERKQWRAWDLSKQGAFLERGGAGPRLALPKEEAAPNTACVLAGQARSHSYIACYGFRVMAGPHLLRLPSVCHHPACIKHTKDERMQRQCWPQLQTRRTIQQFAADFPAPLPPLQPLWLPQARLILVEHYVAAPTEPAELLRWLPLRWRCSHAG